METGRAGEQLICPDCGVKLEQIDDRPGKEAWACPVAIREKLSKEQYPQHKAAYVWE
jgi:hypothetical protein